jgi:hypothetical protein
VHVSGTDAADTARPDNLRSITDRPATVGSMEWSAGTDAGDWLRGRIDDPWRGTMHDVVPRGFAAYARILHPASRDTADGSEPVTWADTAAAFGTTLHPLAQWHRLVGADAPHLPAEDAGGRAYREPEEGRLDPDALAAVVAHGAAHTSTPDDAWIALWEGWGGVLGFFGTTPARTVLSLAFDEDAPGDRDADDDALRARHAEMLARSIPDPVNNVFRRPVWQPGILPDDVSRGPRLELPGRSHVLYRGALAELADPAWAERVPWAEGTPAWTASPSIVWPADRAWALVTEVDYDSTVVGGDAALVAALVADPRIEAVPLPAEASLSWDADRVNATRAR